MAKSQQTWNKKENEKKRQKKREDKELKKVKRKANAVGGDFDNMIAYVDENGNLSSTPPDPSKRKKIIADNIEIGVPKRESIEQKDINRKGIVTFFNDSKGFGFIRDLDSQESIFIHANGLIDHIKENDKVTFQVVQGQKGLNAVEVRVVG
jgi:cold shock CspA family protein